MTVSDIAITTGIGGDTYISSPAPTNDYGDYAYITLDSNAAQKGLFRFDLSGIASDQMCIAASLKLYTTAAETEETYNLYKVADYTRAVV